MQTFLPIDDFRKSLQCLDYRRLGKQRVEAFQLLCANGDSWALKERVLRSLPDKKVGWQNHPAAIMWRPFTQALRLYYNISINEWVSRGYNNTMNKAPIDEKIDLPHWFGNQNFHSSHRAALLFKQFNFYSQFGWTESPALNYIWPK